MSMIDSAGKRLGWSATALAVAGSFLALAAIPANATIRGPQTTTVSCNDTILKTAVTVAQNHTGKFQIKQNSSSPNSTTVVWAVSATGHSLPARTIGNGQTATWTSVLPSHYTVHAHRKTSSNCNGFLPGDGNYNWTYTVNYQG